MPGRKSLDWYGIYTVPSLEEATRNYSCPKSINVLFKLINKSQTLEASGFIEELPERASRGQFDTYAARDYDLTRQLRAQKLVRICTDPNSKDWPEQTWTKYTGPVVFYAFDQLEQKKQIYLDEANHFAQILRNDIDKTSLLSLAVAKSPPSSESTNHFNLPNLDLSDQLTYLDDDHKPDATTKQSHETPDATLGLCTYDLLLEPWKGRGDLIKEDSVRLFDKKFLREVLEHFQLKTPYRRNESSDVVTMSYPMFSFGLWEAKRSLGDSSGKAFSQTARKLATLLRWQRRIFNEAKCEDLLPVVWSFTSVGSD
ncbi:hypothetical protein MMC18_003241 [Xylographa bjoerkii]|nr:hypothetical protein [Xylographa bjoerkii]